VQVRQATIENAGRIPAITERPLRADLVDDDKRPFGPEIDQALIAIGIDNIDCWRLALEPKPGFCSVVEHRYRLVHGGPLVAVITIGIRDVEVFEVWVSPRVPWLSPANLAPASSSGKPEANRINLAARRMGVRAQQKAIDPLIRDDVEIGLGVLVDRLQEDDVALVVWFDFQAKESPSANVSIFSSDCSSIMVDVP